MPQTRDNGIVVPINSDEYNLTQDLATMADSAQVVTVVANSTAQNALTKYEGRQVYRMDTAEVETVVGGVWRSGTRHILPLNNIAGWSTSGKFSVRPHGTQRQVTADLVITRTGGNFVLANNTWSLIGTVVPSTVAGSSPVKYLSCAVVGGSNNYTANAAYNPTGAVSIRSVTDFTFTTDAFITINVVYYI